MSERSAQGIVTENVTENVTEECEATNNPLLLLLLLLLLLSLSLSLHSRVR